MVRSYQPTCFQLAPPGSWEEAEVCFWVCTGWKNKNSRHHSTSLMSPHLDLVKGMRHENWEPSGEENMSTEWWPTAWERSTKGRRADTLISCTGSHSPDGHMESCRVQTTVPTLIYLRRTTETWSFLFSPSTSTWATPQSPGQPEVFLQGQLSSFRSNH